MFKKTFGIFSIGLQKAALFMGKAFQLSANGKQLILLAPKNKITLR